MPARPKSCSSVTGLCWGGASALAARGAGTTAGTSGWSFGSATSTSGDVMSGAGAGVEVRICVGLGIGTRQTDPLGRDYWRRTFLQGCVCDEHQR